MSGSTAFTHHRDPGRPCRELPSPTTCRCLFVTLLLLTMTSQGVSEGSLSQYVLKALKSNYTLFSGPVEVSYTIPLSVNKPYGLIQLVSLKDDSVITHVRIPDGYYTGILSILCGALDNAGEYVFVLREREDEPVLAESDIMMAHWPEAQISLPRQHVALTTGITLEAHVSETSCESGHGASKYYIEVVYYGTNETYFSNHPEPYQFVYREEFKLLSHLQNVRREVDCASLDQGGVYRGRIQSVYDGELSMAQSEIMFVEWNTEYSLTPPRQSVFPCERSFQVEYTHPECSGINDKIRLFEQVKMNSSVASPIRLNYRFEVRALAGGTTAIFSCRKFDVDAYGYCFKYVSMARNSAVREQKAICVPTQDIPVTDGQWGAWSEWGACSLTCGLGKQSRYRVCDSPPPSQGGMFCEGDQVQYKDCENLCVVSTTPVNPYTPDPSCRCGCDLLNPSGTIVSSICPGSSIWTIRAQDRHKIRLRFDVFYIVKANSKTWIKIRDGDTLRHELLVQTVGGAKPATVESSHSTMLIEYYGPYGLDFGSREGFVAHYTTFVDNSTLIAPGDHGGHYQVFWKGAAMYFIGISLCAIVLICTVAFVCHSRRMKKHQHKLRKAQAHQALLSNGEVPNSPSHSASSQQGSANVSFHDVVAGSSPTKTKVLKTPTSPVERKMLKKKQCMSPVHGGRELSGRNDWSAHSSRKGSAGTPGSLHQVPSPYAANAETGDYFHDPAMFRVSPTDESRPRGHSRRRHSPHSPPVSPTRRTAAPYASKGSRSPTKSVGSLKSPDTGAPLADMEDLTPTSHTSPQHKFAKAGKGKMAPINEDIPMDSYRSHGKRGKKGQLEETPLEQRPPVEGRDSLGRKRFSDPKADDKDGHKPSIKPLPLRDVQRPDGQSPENKPTDPRARTPASASTVSEVSPIFEKSQLFPDQASHAGLGSEAGFVEQDFEYDDYMPDLPGSYFTMDPHAYTLTWSQQAPWAQQKPVSQAGSMASIRTTDTGAHSALAPGKEK